MFIHLTPKERFGYVALLTIVLVGGGFVAAQKLRRPAAIELHETTQPPVAFDHGQPKSEEKSYSSRSRTRSTYSSGPIIVHVAGAVKNPGLVELAPGSRVYDAIGAAGGPADDANIDSVNLAAKATDGTQVYVPHRMNVESGGFGPSSYSAAPQSDSRRSPSKTPTQVVDVNSADLTQLQSLPGIGAALAQRIVDYRSEHGTFRDVDDLLAIPGLGKSKLERIRQWLVAN